MEDHFFRFGRKIWERHFRSAATAVLIGVLGVYISTYPLAAKLRAAYGATASPVMEDRNGEIIRVPPNARGYYSRPVEDVPQEFKELLVRKEDRFFYWHLGINPFSVLRDALSYIATGKLQGSSTLTQQLVKTLLGNEGNRTFRNKLAEAFYAVGLELHASKGEILRMYADTAYFGNQAEGLVEASRFYFGKRLESLTDDETLGLLAALNNPSGRYPGSFENRRVLPYLASVLGVPIGETASRAGRDGNAATSRSTKTAFEMETAGVRCGDRCKLTIDRGLTETIREILERNLNLPSFANVDNGAVVAIKLPENELLSLVGSPDPESHDSGYQINMAIRARPIGSTAKPFIYLNAFEKGARPYSLVEDREYAYQIGTGFAFYPKNYDGQYRGAVTLHQALSNSLNVPTVKVLEFVGLPRMYDFLGHSLGFKAIQPLENYELGIALGALEMDLLTLSHYFTLFPNEGILKPLRIRMDEPEFLATPMGPDMREEQRVTKTEFTELVNRILSDRETAADQFGMKSSITLMHDQYALKTGTSRDFHDSWIIGYTPDFLVGVWLGNSDNTPMKQVTGQSGAGKIWHDVMEVLLNSPYHKKTSFRFDALQEFTESGTIEYGLPGDDYHVARLLLREQPLITQPHNRDVFLYDEKMAIPLRAETSVAWHMNDSFLGTGNTLSWHPPQPGRYTITARSSGGREESVSVRITTDGE